MNQKGEITILTLLLVSLITSILAISVYDTARNCILTCKLDHPKYQEIQLSLK